MFQLFSAIYVVESALRGVFHLGDMLEGYRLCESLADRPDMIIPGHDPAVMDLWPRMDVEPNGVAPVL